MKTWKVIRVYKVPANDKVEALRRYHALEAAGSENAYFTAEFAVEDKPVGFWAQVWKQILG
jgi:hypothetical protein